MNRSAPLASLILLLFGLASHARPQSSPLWGNLRPGPYPVGYRAAVMHDRSRRFIPERDYEGKPYAGERSRPLLIQIFYPARIPAGAAPMAYGDYLNFKAETPAASAVVEGLRRRTQVIHEYYRDKYLQPYEDGLFERLLRIRTAAYRDAPASAGRFPVVIYGGGTEFSTDENVALWEYLASHGYAVAVVPMVGASTVSSSADAVGLETQARDMEFLFEYTHELPFMDMGRVGAMGFSYSGQAALLLAMRNPDIKAVVGLDPSFISKHYSRFLKGSPFYNVDNVAVPVLEMHRKDENTVTYDVTGALKYAERYSFEIDDLNHVDFNSYALLYTAALPERAKSSSPVAARKAAFEGMARYVLDFLDVFLKGETNKRAALEKPAAWENFPRGSVTFRHAEALPAPPSYADLSKIIREQGVARGEQIYLEVLKRDPDAKVIGEQSINNLGYELMGAGKVDEAVRVLRLNVERFPRSANAYDSLADAYRKKGDQSCVAYAYRKLLEVLPQDAGLESVKASLRRNATEQLDKLRTANVGRCELEMK